MGSHLDFRGGRKNWYSDPYSMECERLVGSHLDFRGGRNTVYISVPEYLHTHTHARTHLGIVGYVVTSLSEVMMW